MFIVGIFSWWYSAGWKAQISSLRDRFDSLADYFSIELLFRTLFAPFRQISAGRVDGPIGVQLRAFADQLISRCIGAMVRSVIILAGIIAMAAYAVIAILFLIIWPFIPALPLFGTVLAAIGWIPWNR